MEQLCISDYNGSKTIDKGNLLFRQGNIGGAIQQYNRVIEKYPYNSISHYNINIAQSLLNDISDNSGDSQGLNTCQCNNSGEDIKLSKAAKTCFVINTIAAVPDYEINENSSDEEIDEEFHKLFDLENEIFPFTTTPQKNTKFRTEIKIPSKKISHLNQYTDSKVVEKFLSKVSENGFEEPINAPLSTIAVSIGLNRMYSLSTRKNNSLILELESNIKTNVIKYKIFGFYWTCQWYTKDGKDTDIDIVRHFYKRLKSIRPDLAKKFLEQEEKPAQQNRTNIPYQDIREYAKNNENTKDLIRDIRNNNSHSNIYLHFVDVDVLNFNGVYSAYLRIIESCLETPTIMSTGYEFPKDPQYMAYHLLGHMERMHRVITACYVPLGTYYPEPNMCVWIPDQCDTVNESFIDRQRGKGKTLESPILLTAIQNNRHNIHAIFSEDNPIITAMPERVKLCKQKNKIIHFSPEFNNGPAAPTSDDIKKYDQVSQSHSNHLTWSTSLFINNAIKYDNQYETDGEYIADKNNQKLKGVDKQCKKMIANILKKRDVDLSISKLNNRIGENNTKAIVHAIDTINRFRNNFNKEHERTKEEQEFIDIINEFDRDSIACLSREALLKIVNSPIMTLVKDSILDPTVFCNLDIDILENITENDEIIEALHNKTVDFDDVRVCLEEDTESFLNALQEYTIQDIVQSYKNDSLHLKFMGGDPCDIVYMDSDDYSLIQFALEHQYIDNDDINWINRELLGDREESASSMQFTAIIDQITGERYNSDDDIHFLDNYDNDLLQNNIDYD